MIASRRIAAATLQLLFAYGALAEQFPNNAKGFNPKSVYEMNGIDNVNLFNGNLTVAIPIGPAYEIGGGLSYQLRLYSNANLWTAEDRIDLDDETSGDCSKPSTGARVPEPCIHAYPDRRANAGLGFTVSLGRLFPPWEQTNETGSWVYESPDGAEHKFYEDLYDFQDGDPNTFYTTDGTFLRLRGQGNRRTIEFPNGEIHKFMPVDGAAENSNVAGYQLAPWIVETIGNRYANNVLTVTYTRVDGLITKAVLSDGFRSHEIAYVQKPFESGIEEAYSPVDNPDPDILNQRMLVESVKVAGFGGGLMQYTFVYTLANISRPDWHNIPLAYASGSAEVQLLTRLELPDTNAYAFTFVQSGGSGQSGLLYDMTLPTGGRIQWDWVLWVFPEAGGINADNSTPGTKVRRVYDRDGTLIGTTTYTQSLDGNATWNPPPKESKITVVDALGNKVLHYFNIEPLDRGAVGYGLPFTVHNPIANGTRFRSRDYIAADATAPSRTEYVRYDTNQAGVFLWGGREVARRTVYLDDPLVAGAFLDSESLDYDRLGHYRVVTQSGTGIPTTVSTTDYNVAGVPAPTAPWILNTFTTQTLSTPDGVLKTEVRFDANGFLREKRVNADTVSGARTPSDVVSVFTPDVRGNVAREEIFGGDGKSLPLGNLGSFTPALSARVRRIDHQSPLLVADQSDSNAEPEDLMVRRSRFYDAVNSPLSFYSVDVDIDASGLPLRSRDSAGVVTEFRYDAMGRIQWELPTARAWTRYTYPVFSQNHDIVVDTFQPGSFNSTTVTPGPAIGKRRYAIDGLGRVVTEYVEMPGGVESRRETVLNALGWPMTTSELGTATVLPLTTFTYDQFGRVLTTTTPDGSVMSNTYGGIRRKTRTNTISTSSPSAPDTSITTTEDYDILGRLIRVTEKSGPTNEGQRIGTDVVTEYAYDLAGRLNSVAMNKGGGVLQQRRFSYDGRGFLVWESQPESGVTTYTYDGTGSMLSRRQAAVPAFDVWHRYDAAGRLSGVVARNPFTTGIDDEFRDMKVFVYGSANVGTNLSNGKLLTATRYNYGQTTAEPTFRIEDHHAYEDSAGRLTSKTTKIIRMDAFGEDELKSVSMSRTYNELDLPVTFRYPMCQDCGGAPNDPDRRQMQRTYDHGRLVFLGTPEATFVSAAQYWPNGMRHTLTHGNGITDTQLVDAMARPASISFGQYSQCVAPSISVQPASVTKGAGPATLSVIASGVGDVVYIWHNATTGAQVGTGSTVNVNPTATTSYYVRIIGACGSIDSQVAVVSLGSCTMPTTGPISPSRQPDGSWILRPDPTTSASPSYTWRLQPGNTIVGTQRELAVTITQTTTYTLTISDTCGTSAATSVTINLPLPISKTGLVATANGGQISVSWPAVAGATSYILERKAGSPWQTITLSTNSYDDTSVIPDMTYAYRVSAQGPGGTVSDYSNTDVATTRTFPMVSPQQMITATSVQNMLIAVNSVRMAAGWSPVTWANILAPGDPGPVPGAILSARHVMACRLRMNEALQALGVPAQGNVPITDLTGAIPTTDDINEVFQRAQ